MLDTQLVQNIDRLLFKGTEIAITHYVTKFIATFSDSETQD